MYVIETCEDYESGWECAAQCTSLDEALAKMADLDLYDEWHAGWARLRKVGQRTFIPCRDL